MKKIAIIGAGISGMTIAHLLMNEGHDITIYERDRTPGGLIRCKRVNGSLYHICGGHVFNSNRKDVMDWFWSFFNRDEQFIKSDRNSVIFMEDGKQIPYPIENHVYKLDANEQKQFINDLLQIRNNPKNQKKINNFEDFLIGRFGKTLYEAYFRPYNEKIWRKDLKQVPISWLEGKLPMPTVEEMIYNNMNHIEEKLFVHSSFWYEKQGGSQLIVDTFAKNLSIHCCFNGKISYSIKTHKWTIDGIKYDKVVFCGNIKSLPSMLDGISLNKFADQIDTLESHGTTSVFCEIEKNPYSWIYMPSQKHMSHRIICTGNFAESNNAEGKMTGTIEFTDEITKKEILDNLTRIPLQPRYLDHHYNEYTYPIQNVETRSMIREIKKELSKYNFYMTGRFADWEYYNMDVAIGAAIDMCDKIAQP